MSFRGGKRGDYRGTHDSNALSLNGMNDPATAAARIYIGNIPTPDSGFTKAELESMFTKYGKVLGTTLNRNFGFVQFENASSATDAISQDDGMMFRGKRLEVKMARMPRQKGLKAPPPQQQQQQQPEPGRPDEKIRDRSPLNNEWRDRENFADSGQDGSFDHASAERAPGPMDSESLHRDNRPMERGAPMKERGPMDRGPMDRGPMDRGPMDRGPMDRGLMDRGPMDRGLMDRGPMDRGPMDRGLMDRGPIDRGPMDRGPMDRGPMDRGPMDRGLMDRGPMDRGPMDRGPMDRGPMDRGSMDRGPMDRGPMDRGLMDRGLVRGPMERDRQGERGGPLLGGMDRERVRPAAGFYGNGGGDFRAAPGFRAEPPRAPPATVACADRTSDLEIIVFNKANREYGEYIERRLRQLGLSVDLLFPNEVVPIGRLLANISSRGTLYAINVMPQNEEHRSLTLNILHGLPEEHRNMPLEDAVKMISRNFELYIRGEKAAPGSAVPSLPAAVAGVGGGADRHPEGVRVLLGHLYNERPLTALQYNKLLGYLQTRRDRQVAAELGDAKDDTMAAALAVPSVRVPSSKEAELHGRIMNILNSNAAAAPAVAVPAAAPAAPEPGLLNDPNVQKALDSLLSGNLLKSLSAPKF